MEPHGLKPVVPGLPRLALRNRISDFKGKVPEISRKFLGIRYGKILFDNFAILVGGIRQRFTRANKTLIKRSMSRSRSLRKFLVGHFFFKMFHRFFQEAAVEIEADRGDVAMLFLTQDVSSAADLQVLKGDLETSAQAAV